MSYNVSVTPACSGPYLGPSLASGCPGPQFLTFMTLLDTFIRANNKISQLCDRVKPVDPPEDNYDFIVVGGEYFPLLILSLHRAARFGLFPIGCSVTARLYLTFDTAETVYFVASKTVTRRRTVW